MAFHEREAPLAFDRAYVYRRYEPDTPATAIVALHGSGADEMTMLPLARSLDPSARVIAPRGRIMQNGERRWYRKASAISFDQASIRFEAETFARFIEGLGADKLVDPGSTLYLGYSNGANLLASVMLLHPGLIRRAVLLRAMPVLDDPPSVDLSAARVLILGGKADHTYGSYASILDEILKRNGASVTRETLSSGHECGEPDVLAAQHWLDSEAPALIADTVATRA